MIRGAGSQRNPKRQQKKSQPGIRISSSIMKATPRHKHLVTRTDGMFPEEPKIHIPEM